MIIRPRMTDRLFLCGVQIEPFFDIALHGHLQGKNDKMLWSK